MLNALDWMERLRDILDRMDERCRKLPMERTVRMIRSLKKR